MNQADLDIFSVRGFLGIVSLLEERLETNPDGFSPAVLCELVEIEARFRKVVAGITERPQNQSFEIESFERLDRWFSGGFTNLLNFFEDRIKFGPPIAETCRAKMQFTLSRACAMGFKNGTRTLDADEFRLEAEERSKREEELSGTH